MPIISNTAIIKPIIPPKKVKRVKRREEAPTKTKKALYVRANILASSERRLCDLKNLTFSEAIIKN